MPSFYGGLDLDGLPPFTRGFLLAAHLRRDLPRPSGIDKFRDSPAEALDRVSAELI